MSPNNFSITETATTTTTEQNGCDQLNNESNTINVRMNSRREAFQGFYFLLFGFTEKKQKYFEFKTHIER